jgi:hypothetical protein
MIPIEISHTSVQNPTYEFQKRNIISFQGNISSIQNYQRRHLGIVVFNVPSSMVSIDRTCTQYFGTLERMLVLKAGRDPHCAGMLVV